MRERARIWSRAAMSTESASSEFLTASQVAARYGGVSHMWIRRKQRDESFPAAVRFGGRLRFFRLTDLVDWERAKIAGATKAPKPPKRKSR
jgi:predicted DNA-binding transcriptional regulator AlpA